MTGRYASACEATPTHKVCYSFNMKRKVLILSAVAIGISACAPAATIKTYVDPDLNRGVIAQGGVTVLPVLLGSAVKDANIPELRRELANRTGVSVQAFFPTAKIVKFEQTVSTLESEGLMDGFTSTANTFDTTGILKSDTLSKLLAKTETRFAILPYLQSTSATRTGGGIYTTITYDAAFSMVIWDKDRNKVVYEGSGIASRVAGLFSGANILDATYAAFDNAGKKLISDLK